MIEQRVEIVGNRSIQEDLVEMLEQAGLAQFRTVFTEVQGVGESGPRRGDHVWPEENFVLVTYCSTEEAAGIVRIVDRIRTQFPTEGIACFAVGAMSLGEEDRR